MKRVLTAAIALPVIALGVFTLSGLWFFVVLLLVVELAVFEYGRLARAGGAGHAVDALPVLVAVAAVLMIPDLWSSTGGADFTQELLLFSAFLFSGFVAILVLASRGDLAAGTIALGALSFGTPYFALAVASLYAIHRTGPWVLAFLLTIVWLGDIVAFYAGTLWGSRKLAPRVSPNKTWVGAVGGFCAAVTAAAFWSIWRLGALSGELLLLAALTAVAAQLGDLVESLIKRTVGVKDSGALLPGHGGMFDRMDALLLAAPVFALLLWVLDPQFAA